MTHTTRRNFMVTAGAAATASLVAPRRPAAAPSTTPSRNLIIVIAGGGWDATYALDPKPGLPLVDAPDGEIQDFEGLDVFVHDSRPHVTSFFEAYAGMSTIVRGLQVRSIVHPDCTLRVLTGTPSRDNPDIGAILAFEQGIDLPVPYLVLGSEAYAGQYGGITARVGPTKQVEALLNPGQAYPMPTTWSSDFVPTTADEADIRAFVKARAKRERAIRGARGYNRRRVDDFLAALENGDLLRDAVSGFGQRGLTLGTSDQLDLAIQAIADDLAWAVTVSDDQNWDTHSDNGPQGANHDALFANLTTLADDLAARPGRKSGSTMLDETLVAVVSEMSRTPRLNASGGKDHWPTTSILLFGAGVAGGTVVGGTDDEVVAQGIDLQTGAVDQNGDYLQTGNLAAGILDLLGVDPSAYLSETPLTAIKA